MPDNASLSNFYQLAQEAMTQGRGNDPIARIFYAGDQNEVCQVMVSISQMLNTMGSSTQQTAVSGKEKKVPLDFNTDFVSRKFTSTKSWRGRFDFIAIG